MDQSSVCVIVDSCFPARTSSSRCRDQAREKDTAQDLCSSVLVREGQESVTEEEEISVERSQMPQVESKFCSLIGAHLQFRRFLPF